LYEAVFIIANEASLTPIQACSRKVSPALNSATYAIDKLSDGLTLSTKFCKVPVSRFFQSNGRPSGVHFPETIAEVQALATPVKYAATKKNKQQYNSLRTSISMTLLK
jgi:hypothetical protein